MNEVSFTPAKPPYTRPMGFHEYMPDVAFTGGFRCPECGKSSQCYGCINREAHALLRNKYPDPHTPTSRVKHPVSKVKENKMNTHIPHPMGMFNGHGIPDDGRGVTLSSDSDSKPDFSEREPWSVSGKAEQS